jgi:hypothetical protein
MKYKVGDRVCIREDLSAGQEYGGLLFGRSMAKYRGKTAKITEVDGYTYNLDIDESGFWWSEAMLLPAKKTLETLEEGDIVVDKYGGKRIILGVCGKVYFMSCYNDFDRYGGAYTAKDLKRYGYKPVSDEEDENEDSLVGKEAEVTIDGKKYTVEVKGLKQA